MKFPEVNDQITGFLKYDTDSKIQSDGMMNIPNISSHNIKFESYAARAEWIGNNSLMIDKKLNGKKANYFIVPMRTVDIGGAVINYEEKRKFYVVSNGFGACEWHILINTVHKRLAFLHVLREGSTTIDYGVEQGWQRLARRHSQGFFKSRMDTHIDRMQTKQDTQSPQISVMSMVDLKSTTPGITTRFLDLQANFKRTGTPFNQIGVNQQNNDVVVTVRAIDEGIEVGKPST